MLLLLLERLMLCAANLKMDFSHVQLLYRVKTFANSCKHLLRGAEVDAKCATDEVILSPRSILTFSHHTHVHIHTNSILYFTAINVINSIK